MLQKHPVGPLLLAYLSGILLYRWGGGSWWPLLAFGSISFGGWLILCGPSRRLGFCLILVMASAHLQTGVSSRPEKAFLSPCPTTTSLWRARVLGAPFQQANKGQWRARVELFSCLFEGRWLAISPGRIRLKPMVTISDYTVARNDWVQGILTIDSYSGNRHFWDKKPPGSKRFRIRAPFGMMRYKNGLFSRQGFGRIQAELSRALRARLEPNLVGVVLALVLGEKRYLSPGIRSQWADTGVAHLLAISGLHVGLLCFMVWWGATRFLLCIPRLCEYFCVRSISCVFTLLALVFFCWWVHAPISAVRATVMCSFALVGHLWGGKALSWNGLFLAALFILMWRPFALEEYGFWLSFLSTGAILFFMNSSRSSSESALRRWCNKSIEISLLTGLGTAPILAMAFGRISIIAPASNLIAVPVASFVFTPCAFLYSVWVYFDWFGAGVWRWLLEAAYGVIDFSLTLLNRVPFGALEISQNGILSLSLAVLCFFAGWRVKKQRTRFLSISLGFIFMVGAMTLEKVSPTIDALQFQKGEWGMVFPYVGQGDGAILRLPQGEVIVIDAGGVWGPGRFDPGKEIIGRTLDLMGASKIDVAVLTHSHPDHIQGFLYLSEHYPIYQLWYHGDETHPTVRAIIQNVQKKGGVAKSVKDLPKIIQFGKLEVLPLHPRPVGAGSKLYDELNENENSVVLHFRFKNRTALFTGDIEAITETEWGHGWPQSEVLKIPHHGSRTSSTRDFLRAIKPQVGILSVGEGNRFGLPHESVIGRYKNEGIRILRTDCHGAIVARTFGNRWKFETADSGEQCSAYDVKSGAHLQEIPGQELPLQ